jgi:hypothetical protein
MAFSPLLALLAISHSSTAYSPLDSGPDGLAE